MPRGKKKRSSNKKELQFLSPEKESLDKLFSPGKSFHVVAGPQDPQVLHPHNRWRVLDTELSVMSVSQGGRLGEQEDGAPC